VTDTSEDDDPRRRVLRLLRAHGWNTTSFQVLERGFAYWFDAEAHACVAYVDTGHAWVAAGAPIASREDVTGTTTRFVAAAHARGRRASFFAVEERLLLRCADLASMQIGEQPSWDPSVWPAIVGADRRLREQLRRARAKGVSVRTLAPSDFATADAPMREDLEELVAAWVGARKMPPMGFIVDVQPFDFAGERRCFAAQRDGRLVGVLVGVPVYQRGGWLFEDLLRAADAPNGTTELLVDAAMRAVAAEGSRYVTLGLAPLAGQVRPWLRFVRACAAALYDFDGVRRFKAKLRPTDWAPIHLAWPQGSSGNAALYDALAAFTMRPRDGHARASFVRFGLETVAHAPSFGVRVLAVLLVPWTVALLAAPTMRFFPSRGVQLGWVVFDVLLGVGMFALAFSWRLGLARAVAIATTLDALLTVAEVLVDGATRARSLFDAAVLVVACVGPTLATSQLWAALAWRSALLGRSPVRRRRPAQDGGPAR
jgi:phosphatidylglycerol lysyltransferase